MRRVVLHPERRTLYEMCAVRTLNREKGGGARRVGVTLGVASLSLLGVHCVSAVKKCFILCIVTCLVVKN